MLCPGLLLLLLLFLLPLLLHLFFVLQAFMSFGLLNNYSGCLTNRKETQYSLYRRLGGPQSQSTLVQKNLAVIGIQSPDNSTNSELLTDYTTSAH
jgi:hypothetical protein